MPESAVTSNNTTKQQLMNPVRPDVAGCLRVSILERRWNRCAVRSQPKWRDWLGEAIISSPEEFEEAEVAEDLELLADFGADMLIGRVQAG